MNAYKRASFVGIVLFLFGIVIAMYGFSFLLQTNDLQKNGIIVQWKVVGIAEKAIYRSPIVEFVTNDDQKMTFKSRLEVNRYMFDYTIGQEVEVIYHKDDPTNAEINAFREQYMPQIYLGSFGVFLMLLGIFLRWLFLRKAKKFALAAR